MQKCKLILLFPLKSQNLLFLHIQIEKGHGGSRGYEKDMSELRILLEVKCTCFHAGLG